MKNLTKKERKIYDSIMAHFPKTDKSLAIDMAKDGGIKFNFKYK